MNLITVATYACLSVYGTGGPVPKDASGDNDARLEYRESSAAAWQDALPLWFDRRAANEAGNEYGGQEYRGSVCGLKPGTKYELRVTPNGGEPITVTASTWPDPPAGKVTTVGNVSGTYRISESGTPTAYRVFEGGKVDAKGAEFGVVITASYVELRGFAIVNALRHGVLLGPTHEANNADVHDVVISGNDIGNWGSQLTDASDPYRTYGRNLDSAIYSASASLRRITVERNKIHDPRFSANTWIVKGQRLHPRGPQAITFTRNMQQDQALGLYSQGAESTLRVKGGSNLAAVLAGTAPGNHVIRYNEIDSGKYLFNDIMGSLSSNGSNSGFLIRDTDIYGNRFNGNADDTIEGDGAYRNVRIFGNRFERFFQAISFQGRMGGPVYVWSNVFGQSTSGFSPTRGGAVFKTSADGKGPSTIDRLGGRAYVLNNFLMKPATGTPAFVLFQDSPGGGQVRNVRVYNNILQPGDAGSSGFRMNSSAQGQDTNRVDYNLTSAKPSSLKLGAGTTGLGGGFQSHGSVGTPKFQTTAAGDYRLAAGSPGIATALAGFPAGIGPAAVYEYGPLAYLAGVPPIKPPPEQCTCPCPATP